jgi:hypothetical protein
MKYFWNVTQSKWPEYVGVAGPHLPDYTEEDKKNMAEIESSSFALYDDDRTCYAKGKIIGNFDGFEPLDDWGESLGCTSIKIDGEWL